MDRSPNDNPKNRDRSAVDRYRDVSGTTTDHGRYRDLPYSKTVYDRLNTNDNSSSSDQGGPADNQSHDWNSRPPLVSFEGDILDDTAMSYPLVYLNHVLHSIDSDSPRSHRCISLIHQYFRRDQNQSLLEDLLAESSSHIQTFNDIRYLVCDIKDHILEASNILGDAQADWAALGDIVSESFRRLQSRTYVNSIINRALVSENNFKEQCRVYVQEIIQRAMASLSPDATSKDQNDVTWFLKPASTLLDKDDLATSLSGSATSNIKLAPLVRDIRAFHSVRTPADPNKQPRRHSFEESPLPKLSTTEKFEFPFTRRKSTSKKLSLAMEAKAPPKFKAYQKPEDYKGLPPPDRLPSYPKPLFPSSVSAHPSVRRKAKKGRSLIPPASLAYLNQTLTQTHARLTKHYNVWGP